MINYNPETVSTDCDEADRLYFENISLETNPDIYDTERSRGVMLSMGGQTPNNIALPLHRQNVRMIDTAENRYKFSRRLHEIGSFCLQVGYPVLVRPSYVLSGVAMNVDGVMVMHYVSEDVENASVDCGDATLIHSTQDLDPVTVQQIVEATAKIGNALNVTGPYNIQFIAKDNAIKV
ncbi:PreATP-grasp domain-containing protein [Peniophora sp. CONT]|nr:PreATP-grasp domain-containing protein [Peniophora sp. CONT]